MPSKKMVEAVVGRLARRIKGLRELSDEELGANCAGYLDVKAQVKASRTEMEDFLIEKFCAEALQEVGKGEIEQQTLTRREAAEALVPLFKDTGLRIVPKARLKKAFVASRIGTENDFEQALAYAEHGGMVKVDVTSSGTPVVELIKEEL